MRTELSEITTVWNTRLEYFVQVQKLSDSVSDPDFSARAWKGVTAEIANKVQEEGELSVVDSRGDSLNFCFQRNWKMILPIPASNFGT